MFFYLKKFFIYLFFHYCFYYLFIFLLLIFSFWNFFQDYIFNKFWTPSVFLFTFNTMSNKVHKILWIAKGTAWRFNNLSSFVKQMQKLGLIDFRMYFFLLLLKRKYLRCTFLWLSREPRSSLELYSIHSNFST